MTGKPTSHADDEQLLLGEAQLLLSEKRTSLSAMRTGIAVVALPLSVLSVLIATSRLYAGSDVRALLTFVIVVCAVLFVLGLHLIVRALLRMRTFDRRLEELKQQNAAIAHLAG